MTQRKDDVRNVEEFFDSLEEPLATSARELRGLIHEGVPNASESIKWGMPVYETDRLICAIRPGNGYVALQFYASGTSLHDPDGLLEGSGRKMRHVKIRSKRDIKKKLFRSWLEQATRTS